MAESVRVTIITIVRGIVIVFVIVIAIRSIILDEATLLINQKYMNRDNIQIGNFKRLFCF